MVNPKEGLAPAPTSYQANPVKMPEKTSGANRPFMNNEKRFVVPDRGVPAPGTYTIPNQVKVKDKDR